MQKALFRLIPMLLAFAVLAGCGSARPENTSAATESVETSALADGVYSAEFNTDSSMFRVNEACEGRGTLTVQDGAMSIHISLVSKNIVHLFPGTAEEAQQTEAMWLEPTIDTVTYSDGIREEVYGFDVPVSALDETFDLAILGTKGTWYDHKVSVSAPRPLEDPSEPLSLADGVYTCSVLLEGGSGRATVESPATLHVDNGSVYATVEWSSPYYDYMKVENQKYLPVNDEGNSVFEIPVASFDTPLSVTANTVAMSVPHEIDYTLTFDSGSLEEVTQ